MNWYVYNDNARSSFNTTASLLVTNVQEPIDLISSVEILGVQRLDL